MPSTPLVNLALRGIRGGYTQKTDSNGVLSKLLDAKLHSVQAIDLYQKAGPEYSMLLSSLHPNFDSLSSTTFLHDVEEDIFDSVSQQTDLVSIKFKGSTDHSPDTVDTLSIRFHELFVEWNPESIAAINKAIKVPKGQSAMKKSSFQDASFDQIIIDEDSDEEFYDAVEYESGSDQTSSLVAVDSGDDFHLISELSSRASSFSERGDVVPARDPMIPTSPLYSRATMPFPNGMSTAVVGVMSPSRKGVNNSYDAVNVDTKAFQVTFDLSKLRVCLNKESRHRRLLTAEMDRTSVIYTSKLSGGSRTHATIGNLILSDPATAEHSTLYGEILGLKTASFANSTSSSSLLELELIMHPKTRQIISPESDILLQPGSPDRVAEGVTVDLSKGKIIGCDYSLQLRLSPMRFVYLQQLWLEVIDYFFEGIIGYEVWGKERPPVLSSDGTSGQERPTQDSPSLAHKLTEDLPGAKGETATFMSFSIYMEAPVVLIPVTYQSPQFLRLDLNSINVHNFYTGIVEKRKLPSDLAESKMVQWYNNCDLKIKNLRLSSWCGAYLGPAVGEEANAHVDLNWPTGPMAPFVLPKWKIKCSIDAFSLVLRKADYALLQHIINLNIGEPSRHLEEWNALQNLPPSELEAYKRDILVNFGYDKKDTKPTTYNLDLSVPCIQFSLLGAAGAQDVVAEANCASIHWHMRKLADRISRQSVTCDITLVAPAVESDGAESYELLLPSPSGVSSDTQKGLRNPELRYTSSSRIPGDNVKSLEISDAVINMVYPSWMRVKDFFSSLEAPRVMSKEEVQFSMQIGDRWYPIGGSTIPLAKGRSSQSRTKDSNDTGVIGSIRETGSSSPSYQFRLLLVSPRIILSAGCRSAAKTHVILRMAHLDFLHRNCGITMRTTKTFCVHDLELYTSAHENPLREVSESNNSLIHPWTIIGMHDRCSRHSNGNCKDHTFRLRGDILQARAAYSDISKAVDVCLRLVSDVRTYKDRMSAVDLNSRNREELPTATEKKRAEQPSQHSACHVPRTKLTLIGCSGLELMVVDDSRRHFAGAQRLVEVSFGSILFTSQSKPQVHTSLDPAMTHSTTLSVKRIELSDCLQAKGSRFRLIGTTRPLGDGFTSSSTVRDQPISWAETVSVEHDVWGYDVSQTMVIRLADLVSKHPMDTDGLVEMKSFIVEGTSRQYDMSLKSFTMQWNPSTVIALQRFSGRLLKEARSKAADRYGKTLKDLFAASSSTQKRGNSSADSSDHDSVPNKALLPVRASCVADNITICLNKEHQNRSLLRVTMSGSQVALKSDSKGMLQFSGCLRDLNAWDSDGYVERGAGVILPENRQVLSVLHNSSGRDSAAYDQKEEQSFGDDAFFRFHYSTFSSAATVESRSLPKWVLSHLLESGEARNQIDDYLTVSVATVQFNYIRERSEEVLDYLSNGLPGKGMGVTSKAAKGFIKKRIQTRSFLDLTIHAPQVSIPRREDAREGLLVRLGDVSVRSWFEESRLRLDGVPEGSEWCRLLSLSLIGLGWNTYSSVDLFEGKETATGVQPFDINLQLRKPTGARKAITVKGTISYVDLILNYSSYVLARAVLRENIGRKIDMSRWDNVEKAFWMEQAELGSLDEGSITANISVGMDIGSTPIAYASNARFVRYGQKGKRQSVDPNLSTDASGGKEFSTSGNRANGNEPTPSAVESSARNTVDINFDLQGLNLKFHRDDLILDPGGLPLSHDLSTMFTYDIMLLRLERAEVSLSSNSDGDKSLNLSLFQISLFDIGDTGRLSRERYFDRRASRMPSAFSVIAEGYESSKVDALSSGSADDSNTDPQLVITVDTCPASSIGNVGMQSLAAKENEKVTVARIVLNFLGVNVLIRPLREIVSFLTCAWPTEESLHIESTEKDGNQSRGDDEEPIRVETETQTSTKNTGFQVKLVAHYPRLFFVADESNPNSRALVLRGLAIVNASIVKQVQVLPCDSWLVIGTNGGTSALLDSTTVTAIDAQFHSMESYINPDVEDVLGLKTHHISIVGDSVVSASSNESKEKKSRQDNFLGVALIEPVTFGAEFCETSRDRFPSLRTASVNMDPVSTMLSFEDLSLIESVLEKWSASKAERRAGRDTIDVESTEILQKETKSHSKSARHSGPRPLQESDDGSLRTEKSSFDVTFQSPRLGLVLKSLANDIVVESLAHVSNELHSVKVGDVVKAINGDSIEGDSLQDVLDRLASCPRPTTVTFSRQRFGFTRIPGSVGHSSANVAEVVEDLSSSIRVDSPLSYPTEEHSFTIAFRMGTPTGFTFESHPCGDVPVLTHISPTEYAAAAVRDFGSPIVRIPRTGAVVTHVDTTPSSKLGFEESQRTLDQFAAPTLHETVSEETTEEMTYSITFVELESSSWGKVDEFIVAIAGAALTFIDDVRGRDMPLLRGRLQCIDIHIERGVGLKATLIESIPPTFLCAEPIGTRRCSSTKLAAGEIIQKITTAARTEIDYFHPRISVWEPLVEPSQICIVAEWQAGIDTIPGRLAIEVSDRFLHNRNTHPASNETTLDPRVICVNLTEPAAGVIFRASREWKLWRLDAAAMRAGVQDEEVPLKRTTEVKVDNSVPVEDIAFKAIQSEISDELGSSDRLSAVLDSGLPRKRRSIVAQRAAQAALNFATKRGAGNKESSESAKPFVFQNRTGVTITFIQQMHGRESGRLSRQPDFSKPMEVFDGDDARFHMESSVARSDEEVGTSQDSFKANVNRMRTYEGHYPSLTVTISVAGVDIEPLTNLPVFKVGRTTRHLLLRKTLSDELIQLSESVDGFDVVGPETESNLFSVPVVWSVEIQDNRRILTLSSAVKIESLGDAAILDVGFLPMAHGQIAHDSVQPQAPVKNRDDSVRRIGTAGPGAPFFLPLWLAMKRESVAIFVRPTATVTTHGEVSYEWSPRSVLVFIPAKSTLSGQMGGKIVDEWIWKETMNCVCTVSCTPCSESHIKSPMTSAIWMACFSVAPTALSGSSAIDLTTGDKPSQTSVGAGAIGHSDVDGGVSVFIDSCLTFRNLLPTDLEWEVASFEGTQLVTLDCSSSRSFSRSVVGESMHVEEEILKNGLITSGTVVDVRVCNVMQVETFVRFRIPTMQTWSKWSKLPVAGAAGPPSVGATSGKDKIVEHKEGSGIATVEDVLPPETRQLNVQMKDDFGVPITIGLRVVPKLCTKYDGTVIAYGVDVIAHAELWIRNLTSLPLVFGCPSSQLHAHLIRDVNEEDGSEPETVSKAAAEAALMEIASVLEIGERGKGFLSGEDDRTATSGSFVEYLPYQQSEMIYHEVFEYIEIESSTVKRRWWGSENQSSWRSSPEDITNYDSSWEWMSSSWCIDCSGHTKAAEGGWESCRSLHGGKEDFFSERRTFNPHHAFRRRRWFRRRKSVSASEKGNLLSQINAIHQPVVDNFTRAQEHAKRKARKHGKEMKDESQETYGKAFSSFLNKGTLQISIKCGDGQWGKPCIIPSSGRAHGVVRLLSTRWPTLTKTTLFRQKGIHSQSQNVGAEQKRSEKDPVFTADVDLDPQLYELCYQVSDLEGDWGEFSRLCLLTPRFMFRNDSKLVWLEVKQAGASDETATILRPSEVVAFYWADFRLPELVCIRPLIGATDQKRSYKWSGGFDIGRLGMTAIRVRLSHRANAASRQSAVGSPPSVGVVPSDATSLKSIRSLVEIRSGTGGTGINVSFREEDPGGSGSLFRVENLSPFSIWLGQDGVLANPGVQVSNNPDLRHSGDSWGDYHPENDGDCVRPMRGTAFALDVPFRQGKYAGRKVATMEELLRVRVGLAPLHTREGIESTKVIGLTEVGESIRLNPSKLVALIGVDLAMNMLRVRVLGVVSTDGPTRVLRFCLMKRDDVGSIFRSPLSESAYDKKRLDSTREMMSKLATKASLEASQMLASGVLLSEGEAKRMAFFGRADETSLVSLRRDESLSSDRIFSFRAALTGFTCSFVDSAPSEIALVSLKNVNALARWNANRTADGSVIISVGWLQIDNHVPSAPFPVAVSPDEENLGQEEGERGEEVTKKTGVSSPLLLVGITFAPVHKSGILCLRSVTVAPRDLAVAVDLAFIVRLQRFFVSLGDQWAQAQVNSDDTADLTGQPVPNKSEPKRALPFPDIDTLVKDVEGAGSTGSASQKMYFEGLTVLPFNVNLSVAPARALTASQANLEGPEAAAIHAAVRKGDLLLGSGLLGVRVGRRNKTALAVVRGVFKSIVVDALLRCDSASLAFSGVFLRNHISSGPQLKTYLGAHYMSSLRNNVPTLLGSLAAFGNPLGLIRGLGDGVSDFVAEPVKGLKRSMQELDPFFVVDGVARGTESLARHAVGGFAGSASMLTETFSKNMAVLTLDRRYSQRRDRGNRLRGPDGEVSATLMEGVESGFVKLVRGVLEGVTGVIRAPIRGAEKSGFEGFAKGIGKGLLGLLVKPVIGISDAATDVMIGVQGSVEGGMSGTHQRGVSRHQIRPRRPLYGRDQVLRTYSPSDAAAATLMMRTRLAGEAYLGHCDMGGSVALLSVKRALVLGEDGNERLLVKYKHIRSAEVQKVTNLDGSDEWGIVIVLSVPRRNGSEVEIITCQDKKTALDLCEQINHGLDLVAEETM